MKTAELTGAALDWAVAMAEGWTTKRCGMACDCLQYVDHNGRVSIVPYYSTDWSYGGPIIEREFIYLKPSHNHTRWRAYTYDGKGQGIQNSQFGPTALIAAMRCYVASKLGDEVEL